MSPTCWPTSAGGTPAFGQAATLVGLAGTVAALAAIAQELDSYDRRRVHHYLLTRDTVEALLATLAAEPTAARRRRPGVEPDRADVIVGRHPGPGRVDAPLRVRHLPDLRIRHPGRTGRHAARRPGSRRLPSPAMVVTDRVLMGPGPCNPYPEATAGLARPMLGHLDPEFIGILDETCERLRTVWGTGNTLTLPVSGTGSAGMEAAFVNTVGPGDVVVIGVNGLFGERMCDVAGRCGAEVVRVEAPWGQPLDPDALLSAHPSPKLIALVHAETSTGVRNDVAAVAAGKGEALVLADCVTSLGGIPVDIDGWGVDVAYSGTQKCLGVAPGLAPFTLGPTGLGTAHHHAAQLVSRPRHDRRVHDGLHPQVPPHRPRRHDHVACTPPWVRCSTRGCPPPGIGMPSAGRPCRTASRRWAWSCGRPEGYRLPAADHRPGPRDVDDAAVRADAAAALRHRDRRGSGPLGRPGLAHRLYGAHRPLAQRHFAAGGPRGDPGPLTYPVEPDGRS